jgi:UDP-glucose 4-epimerase
MKILVTGGNGFIGQYVVEELLERKYEVLVLDRLLPVEKNENVEYMFGDITDSTQVTEAMAHSDGWIHLAGVLGTAETIYNPRPAAETNILGGLNVLEAATQYKLPGVNIAVGNHWFQNTYSITKSTVERFCVMFREERDLQVSVVRALNAYGPRQSIAAPYGSSKVRKIMPSFICRALTGTDIEIYGTGNNVMDMIHVSDVAKILVNTLEETIKNGALKEVQEAGTSRRTTVNDIAVVVRDSIDRLNNIDMSEPPGVQIKHIDMRPGEKEGEDVIADPDKLFKKHDFITLEQGVEQTVNWYKENWLPIWYNGGGKI